MSPQKNRRRIRLIDRKFQLGLASRLLLVVSLFFFLGLALVFAPSFYLLATTDDPKSLEAAATEVLMLHKRIWPAALLSFAGVFIYSLRFSQRIAGPIYRINGVLRQFLRGEYPEKITFRENDYFVTTATLMEQLSGKLRDASGKSRGNAQDDHPCSSNS